MPLGLAWRSHRLRWNCERPFVAPAAFLAPVNRVGGDTGSPRPLGTAERKVTQCELDAFPRVPHLLGLACPPTVFRRVVAVGIDPINRVFRRGSPFHVFKKRLEAVLPSRANRNTTAAVVFVVRCVRIRTTLAHTEPNLILGCFRSSVCSIQCANEPGLETATALRGPPNQSMSAHDFFPAARASTAPSEIAVQRSNPLDNGQSSEHLARKVPAMEASATLNDALAQISAPGDLLPSTFTNAAPAKALQALHNSEPSERLSGDVYESGHGDNCNRIGA